MFFKLGFLKVSQISLEKICVGVSFDKVAGLKAQMFSCEICKNFENIFFYRTPRVAASEMNV